jgi:hypothetical protein
MRWAGHVARVGEMRNAYNSFVGNPEGKRPLGKPRYRWEDIRISFRVIGCEGVDWMHLVLGRDQWRAVAYAVMNFRVA